MSDTHYCSKDENKTYIDRMFNYSVEKGINIMLHAGDIIEGLVEPREGFDDLTKQAFYFIENYPKDKNIMTYALLGNHDFNAINNGKNIRKIIDVRDDINIIGFKKNYLNWCNYIIGIQHDINDYKLIYPFKKEIIEFKGHSHFFNHLDETRQRAERIHVPALCDKKIPKPVDIVDDLNKSPGFLIATIDYENMLIEYMVFKNNKIIKQDEFIKPLDKKYKVKSLYK